MSLRVAEAKPTSTRTQNLRARLPPSGRDEERPVAAAEAELASPRTRNPKRERQESEAVLRPAKRVRREVQTVEPQQRARVRWSATCQRREYDVGSKSYEFLTGTCPLRRLRSL